MQPIQLFDLASRQAEWLTIRQQVVAGNIANANTPKFRAKDVTPFDAVLDKSDITMAEMDKRKAEYQDWLKRRDDFLKQAEAGLTEIYKKMKPDSAALQLQDMKIEVASAVIMRLGPRQSSLILNEMDPKKAAAIASVIASASDPNTSKDPS